MSVPPSTKNGLRTKASPTRDAISDTNSRRSRGAARPAPASGRGPALAAAGSPASVAWTR